MRHVATSMGASGATSSVDATLVTALVVTNRPARFSSSRLTYAETSLLKELVAGRSDEEVEAAVLAAGEQPIVDVALRGVAAASPSTMLKQRIIIQLSLRTREGDALYYIRLDGEHRNHHHGMALNPETTLMLRLATLLRIVAGEMNGISALANGRIRAHGGERFARSLLSNFEPTSTQPVLPG